MHPVFGKRPTLAIVASVLFSAITFGMEHGGSWMARFADIGLLYGPPMAVVFVRRDAEHAIGAHYMINMVSWLMVFLGI